MLAAFVQTVKLRVGTTNDLFRFLWRNKMWWMVPMILFLILGFALIVLVQSSPVGPFIYTLF